MAIRIIGTGSYAPEKILTNADLEKMVETSDEWITTRTGIKQRHIAADGVATSVFIFFVGTEHSHCDFKRVEQSGTGCHHIVAYRFIGFDLLLHETCGARKRLVAGNGCHGNEINLVRSNLCHFHGAAGCLLRSVRRRCKRRNS